MQNFELKTPVTASFGRDGTDIEVSHVQLAPPTAKQAETCLLLDSIVGRAQLSAARAFADVAGDSDDQTKSLDDLTLDERVDSVLQLFNFVESADSKKLPVAFRALFKSPDIALAGGEKVVNDDFLDRLDYVEYKRLCAFYYANFMQG